MKNFYGYQSTFSRNIHERTNFPVFSIEDAVREIKMRNINMVNDKNSKSDLNQNASLFLKEIDNFS